MKKILLISFLFYINTFLYGKVLYLDNTLSDDLPSQNLYNDFATAHDNCNPHDSIYVLGTTKEHWIVTINKPVTVIGPGYFLDQNSQTQLKHASAEFVGVNFGPGSDSSKIIGLKINNNGIDINNTSNITIQNCFIDFIIWFGNAVNGKYENIIIQSCYFKRDFLSIESATGTNGGILTNFVMTNNIFNEGFTLPDGSDGIIANNVIHGSYFISGVNSNFSIVNNILINDNEDNFKVQSNSVEHNISTTGAFGSANGNKTASYTELFLSEGSTDGKYQLNASHSNPAKGQASDGGDIGAFSGPKPYRLSGLPPLPNIYEVSTGGIVSGDEFKVRIKIKQ
jgi:hypothetical protein